MIQNNCDLASFVYNPLVAIRGNQPSQFGRFGMKLSTKAYRLKEVRTLDRQLVGVSIASLVAMIVIYTGFVAS